MIPLLLETVKVTDNKMEAMNAKISILNNVIKQNEIIMETLYKKIEKLEKNIRKSDSSRKKRLSMKK